MITGTCLPQPLRQSASFSPRAFLIENVRGLTRSTFANYFQLVLLGLQYPEVIANEGKMWINHLKRLQSEHTSSKDHGLAYNVTSNLVSTADYGGPQQRHRVFRVAYRNDVAAMVFPRGYQFIRFAVESTVGDRRVLGRA